METKELRAQPCAVRGEEMLGHDRRPDYADAFEVQVREDDPRAAVDFLRDGLEQSPTALRQLILFAHERVLRFRLGPVDSPTHVLGWRVVEAEPETAQLAADGPLLSAVLLGRRTAPDVVSLTTFVYFERPAAARAIWAITRPVHQRVAPFLMERAAIRPASRLA
jgi:hypothetical protein